MRVLHRGRIFFPQGEQPLPLPLRPKLGAASPGSISSTTGRVLGPSCPRHEGDRDGLSSPAHPGRFLSSSTTSPHPSLTLHPRARLAPIPAASSKTEGFGDAGGGDTSGHTPWPPLHTPWRHRGVPPARRAAAICRAQRSLPPPGRGPGALGREQKVDKGSKIKGAADKGSSR